MSNQSALTHEAAIDNCFEVLEMINLDRLKFQYEQEQAIILELVQYVLHHADQRSNKA
ncbi:MAG: hypothetical protein IBX55_18295 [Methyloprofundus sp.]|nr:hypothetical protein [Methyloprofundus sp.]